MSDYSYINFNKFIPTKYPNWGYQLGRGTELIIYYPTGEVWELGELKGWHDNTTFDIIVFIDADATFPAVPNTDMFVDYMYGAGATTVDEAIEYFNDRLGYDLGKEE